MFRFAVVFIAVLAIMTQFVPAQTAEKDGFVSLMNASDWAGWEENHNAWNLQGDVLAGRSDGSSPTILVVKGRDFGDFELRFEALVNRGAVRVKMRGPGPGPVGVALEINAERVEWFTNGMPFFVAASNHPGKWNEYRVVVWGSRFKLWQNGKVSALELAVGHLDTSGKLELHLSEGKPSEIALRHIRIR